MIKLVRGTLTAVTKFRPERTRISLSERGSTCAPQMGPGGPEISIGDWLQSEDGPAQGTVWIVKKIEQQVESRTWTIQAEHAINLLRRRILPGEVKPEDMGGSTTGCTARQAAAYILSRQSDWVLGDCAFSDSHPYSFNGDDLFSALETVSNSLDGCVWEYDFSVYPFRLHLRQETNGVESEIRLSRNARTIRRTIDTQDTCTRFYPVGKENLKLPGVGYVSRNEGLYGVFEQTDTDESLDSVAKLTDWADSYLRRHAHPLVTLVVDGMELAQDTGESLDRFRIGRLCRVPLVEYGEAAVTERISKIDYPDAEGDPEKCTITIGGEIDDIAKIVSRMQKKRGGGGRASPKNAEEDHAWIEDPTEHV
jgi:phage minor structural protein